MRTRLFGILIVLMLLASAAKAQPLIVTEHDWTLRVGGGRYGLCQEFVGGDTKHGERYTTIWFGTHLVWVRMRAGWLIALVVVPLGAMGAFMLVGRGTTRRS
jgi:hypothetical protein